METKKTTKRCHKCCEEIPKDAVWCSKCGYRYESRGKVAGFLVGFMVPLTGAAVAVFGVLQTGVNVDDSEAAQNLALQAKRDAVAAALDTDAVLIQAEALRACLVESNREESVVRSIVISDAIIRIGSRFDNIDAEQRSDPAAFGHACDILRNLGVTCSTGQADYFFGLISDTVNEHCS